MDKLIAQTVLTRGKGYCERCGTPGEDFHLHHRKLKSQGGKDAVANLVAVCHTCHNIHPKSIHQNPAEAKRSGFIVPSWANPEEYPLCLPDGRVVRLDNEGNYLEIGK